jgi:hypothetical protein
MNVRRSDTYSEISMEGCGIDSVLLLQFYLPAITVSVAHHILSTDQRFYIINNMKSWNVMTIHGLLIALQR